MTDNDEKPVYYTTSEAAQELQIPEHELRYWEIKKLLIPIRTMGGQRRYRQSDIRRGEIIKDLLKQGYNSKGIRNILSRRKGSISRKSQTDFADSAKRESMLLDLKKEVQEILKILKNM